ncbi:MAG TPA: hydroxyacid dehydrogenase, partial [Candidatus Kapabacteria bacterium]|nr:hydroxyacid dehydrogenase [Candidatus Kapabacteria bacterium]
MSITRILIADPLDAGGVAILRREGFDVDVQTGLSEEQLLPILPEYTAMIVRSGTQVTERMIGSMEHMKFIARAGVGVDNIDVAAATRKSILVMNAPNANTVSTAEHTLAMIFSLARHIPFAHAELRQGTWNRKKWMGIQLEGKTLGVIGFGKIGSEVAKKANAIGMRVVAYDPLVASEFIVSRNAEPAALPALLSSSDIITVHVPLTNVTRGLLGEKEFSLCKRGVLIINCARGGIVDETHLYEAIEKGIVAGAALDVFAEEPPAKDNPLLHDSRVIVTPHIGSATIEAQMLVAIQIAEQL